MHVDCSVGIEKRIPTAPLASACFLPLAGVPRLRLRLTIASFCLQIHDVVSTYGYAQSNVDACAVLLHHVYKLQVYVDFEAEGAEKEMLAEKRAQLTAALHGLAGGGNGNSAAIEGALDGLLGGTGGDDGDIDKDSVDDDEDEIREEEGQDGEGEQDDAEGGDQKWRTTSPRLLMYRTDPRSRAQRTAARAAAVAAPLRLPPLNGEVLQSLNSLVRDRLGAIDRIVRSAQIGAAQ